MTIGCLARSATISQIIQKLERVHRMSLRTLDANLVRRGFSCYVVLGHPVIELLRIRVGIVP